DGERADLVKPVQLRRSGSFVYLRKLIQRDKVSLIICKGQRFHIVYITAVKGIQLDANIVLVLSVLQSRVDISCKSILHSRPNLAESETQIGHSLPIDINPYLRGPVLHGFFHFRCTGYVRDQLEDRISPYLQLIRICAL